MHLNLRLFGAEVLDLTIHDDEAEDEDTEPEDRALPFGLGVHLERADPYDDGRAEPYEDHG